MYTVKFKNVANAILLDPFLFKDFFKIKHGIPFFKEQNNIYILTNSSNEGFFKVYDYKIIPIKIDNEDFFEKVFLIKNFEKWQKEKCFQEDSPVRSILDFILINSISENASDIHFDAIDNFNYEVKFKVDTVLKKFLTLTKIQGESIIMRLKVLSSLDTAKKNFPQSSSFYRNYKNIDIDFRFSTHPTFLGERCVIRVLQQKNVLNINELGFDDDVLNIAKKIINEPYGFVILTGPTNSGKTTTIHSILKEISNSGVNIMTLEDPVEYRIPGIIQTNVSENFTFFDGMKSILRQDPTIIFIGEIRDEKTAKLAAQISMVGHKVFTTLHAYSIKGAINRLIDMGISEKILSESLLAIFSQRLVRKLDSDKKSYKGLSLISDAVFFDEDLKDILRLDKVPDIPNKLKERAQKLIESGITTTEEIKRVIGS